MFRRGSLYNMWGCGGYRVRCVISWERTSVTGTHPLSTIVATAVCLAVFFFSARVTVFVVVPYPVVKNCGGVPRTHFFPHVRGNVLVCVST